MKKNLISINLIFLMLLSLSGCEQQINSSVSITENQNELTNDNETITKTSNSETVTYLKESNSSYDNNYSSKVLASGKNSVIINNGQVYLNGEKLDIDVSRKVNISYKDDDEVTINDKSINDKSINDKSITSKDVINKKELNKEIEITLTGKLVKVPFFNISEINSSIPVVQNCSKNSETYLMIDSALEPYLNNKDNLSNGFIHLKNGSYKIMGNMSVSLFSQPIQRLINQGGSKIEINCTDPNTLNLTNNGIGNIIVSNVNNKLIDVTQKGVGTIDFLGTHANEFHADNEGIGKININFPISKARFNNSGIGSITATDIETLEAQNEGIGNINITQVKNISKLINKSIGNINIEQN